MKHLINFLRDFIEQSPQQSEMDAERIEAHEALNELELDWMLKAGSLELLQKAAASRTGVNP